MKSNRWKNFISGLVSESEIIEDFREMRKKVDGSVFQLINDAGEIVSCPMKSRWNSNYNYGGAVGRRVNEEIRSLKILRHFILTVDPKNVAERVPDYWAYGEKEYVAAIIGSEVTRFLQRLQLRKKRRNERWNFIAWFFELHQSGYVHVHFMFYGKWVATFEEIAELWGWCAPNGVRFAHTRDGKVAKFAKGEALAGYLSHYLSIDLAVSMYRKEFERIAAFLWFFKRRLYNMRHKRINENGKVTYGIPGEEKKKNPEGWKLYRPKVTDGHEFRWEFVDVDGSEKVFTSVRSALKWIREMPVLHPESTN